MSCPVSTYISLDKCRQLRSANNLACAGCNDMPTRCIRLELPADVYEVIQGDAKSRGVDLETSIIDLLKIAASKDYVLMLREDSC